MPIAVVTGGSSGIGQAVARVLARTHDVYILDIAEPQVGQWVRCDVREPVGVRRAFAGLRAIDIAINSAAVFGLRESAGTVFRTNFLGAWLCCREETRRGAHVVNVSSRLSGPDSQAPWHSPCYILSKLCLEMLDSAMVSHVRLGIAATPMTLQWRGTLAGLRPAYLAAQQVLGAFCMWALSDSPLAEIV